MSRWFSKFALMGAAGIGAGLAVRASIRARRFYDLADKLVLLTGGSRGLGLELARQLVEKDARLAICARDEGELREAREDLERRLPRDLFVGVCDVTDPDQVRAFVEQVRDEVGAIDVLINNAGIITVGPFDTLDRRDFQDAFATHVSGPLELIKTVLPDLRRRRGGRIVNIASIGGKVPLPHMAAYAASKHALVGLSGSIRAELVAENIYVTTVNPGVMRTGSPWHAKFKGDPQAEYAWFAALDNLPGLAISPVRMARRIIDAMEHGDAELTAPLPASLAAGFHGLFSGVSTELAGLHARLLPTRQLIGAGAQPVMGREADVGQLPEALHREQLRNAARYNEA